MKQNCFTWFPLVLVEGCGVLPASSSYARAGWGMVASEGSGAACWKHMLAHLLASAVSVLLQRLEYKCTQRKRHLKIDICSVATPFQPQLIMWILFRVNEGKPGSSRIPSHHIYFRPLPWGEVKSILEVLVSAVSKVSLDNWLEIRTGESPLWYWIPFQQDLPNFTSSWLAMSMPSWATSLVLQAEFFLAS